MLNCVPESGTGTRKIRYQIDRHTCKFLVPVSVACVAGLREIITEMQIYYLLSAYSQWTHTSKHSAINWSGLPNNQFHFLLVLWIDLIAVFWSHEHHSKAKRWVPEPGSMALDHRRRQYRHSVWNNNTIMSSHVSQKLPWWGCTTCAAGDTHCCHMGTAIEHPVPDRVKALFVIFDIRALWRSALSVRVPACQKLQMTVQPGLAQDALWLYSYGNSGRQRVNGIRWWTDGQQRESTYGKETVISC